MSYGICFCSKCHREVHYKGLERLEDLGSPRPWIHCNDQTVMCEGATAAYPQSTDDIVGEWCGRDKGPF